MAERTEAERLRSAEITLATIREHVELHLRVPVDPSAAGRSSEHARGFQSAMRDVLAILDARWLPEGAPVNLPWRS